MITLSSVIDIITNIIPFIAIGIASGCMLSKVQTQCYENVERLRIDVHKQIANFLDILGKVLEEQQTNMKINRFEIIDLSKGENNNGDK